MRVGSSFELAPVLIKAELRGKYSARRLIPEPCPVIQFVVPWDRIVSWPCWANIFVYLGALGMLKNLLKILGRL